MKALKIKLENEDTLLLIGVPFDAHSFQLLWPDNKNELWYRLGDESRVFDKIYSSHDILLLGVYAPPENINFDINPAWVESWDSVSGDGTKVFQNYLSDIPKKRTAGESFLSLLAAETKKAFPLLLNPISNQHSFTGRLGSNVYQLSDKEEAEKLVMPGKFAVLLLKPDTE